VAHDEDLANRLRELLQEERGLTEKRMFGGLAFLINGNMSIAASGQGGLLVRVDPAETEKLASRAGASKFQMRGREMNGWLRVDASAVRAKRELDRWARIGVAYARTLPKK
jgi:TfoX/Sxy family transcriptional regulator of competence genes